MAFGTMTGAKVIKKEKRINGKQEVVACDCWFTSKGRTIPRWIKYQDEKEVLHCISDIRILRTARTHYCGIDMMEYECTSVVEGRLAEFKLLFQLEECSWKIIWKK